MDWGVVGRERELAAVQDWLDQPDGISALLLEGEAGIGKTTVWLAAAARAREAGYRALTCRTAEAELSLPFVSLGDLLEPVIDDALAGLPAAQRLALESALARVQPEESFGWLSVSRATLAALRALAAGSPLLIAIDDVQWLDTATRSSLDFALRRLTDGRIRILVSRRTGTGHEAASRLPAVPVEHLSLGPLSVDDLARVIAARLQEAPPRPRLVELHRMTEGNPYFALEIMRAWRGHRAPLSPEDRFPVPEDIAAVLRRRIAELPAPALELLVLAAACPQPTASLLAAVTNSTAGLEAAIAAGILERDGERLRFTHPLLASVLYDGLDDPARREAHRRLAVAVPSDSVDRALHLARATTEPDEAVAEELDAAASRAYGRGAPVTAAELAEHSCRLTATDDARPLRTRRSAEYRLAAGDTERGRALLEQLLEFREDGPERAHIALRLGNVRYLTDDIAAAHALFGEALRHAGSDDGLRVEAQQALAFTAMLGGNIAEALEHARSSRELAQRLGDRRALAMAESRLALNQFLSGQGLDRTIFERAVELEEPFDEMPFEWLPSYAYAGVAVMADDLDTARALYERLAEVAVVHGDERAVPTLLFASSELECRLGNWARATRQASEAVERSRQVGLGTVRAWSLYALSLVNTHVGDVETARAAASEGLSLARAAGAVPQISQLESTLGFLELSVGDAAAANSHLGPLADLVASFGLAEPGVVRFMPNQIEALIGLGELDAADRLLVPLEARAQELDRISARAAAARCRALLLAAAGDFELARASIGDALVQHDRLQEPFERARTLLVQGITERRAKRRSDAREALTSALRLFDALGAGLWSEKAASELARIPGRAPSPQRLSEAERRVAGLASQGLSNKEIAGRMFVTVRTVEAHLSKIYAKLGVRSRVELASQELASQQRLRAEH